MYRRRPHARQWSRPRSNRRTTIPPIQPRADPRLRSVFAQIGVPEEKPFRPDPFQLQALSALEHADCLVTAPTGSGKTWIAQQAIARVLARGGRAWYASPLKALSNSKHAEFTAIFGAEQVGILTGDRKENTDAPIVVGTTEILRNQLYDAMYTGQDVRADLVILDEAHFLGDVDRGVVWEEVMIYLPATIPLLLLSATIGNADEIADWLSSIRGRECAVVQETRRPVPLYHLFLHPSGTLFPLLAPATGKGKPVLDGQVLKYLALKDPPQLSLPSELPPFGEIIGILAKYSLLPAIFFLKSRADCDRALRLCQARDSQRNEQLRERVDDLLAQYPFAAGHPQLHYLRNMAVGAHHGGQLPMWKLLLETCMTEGLLDAIFATSTVSAGVNFPARSIVFLNSDRFDGHEFSPLTPTEFHQMIGRAGRRGKDRIGFAITVPGPFMDARLVATLVGSPPSDILSQIRVNFSMVLNLLLSYTPPQIEDLMERSFAAHARRKWQRAMVDDFRRHLRFLRDAGYVTADGSLTAVGRWASQLRVDQPLLIAEGLRRGVLPQADPSLLAAIIASFVHEKDSDDQVDERLVSKRLESAFLAVKASLHPFLEQLRQRGFEARPLFLRPAGALYAWATGASWSRVVLASGTAAGDLAMLISRTADNLRHVGTLTQAFPEVATAARQAVDLIMREPVVVEYG